MFWTTAGFWCWNIVNQVNWPLWNDLRSVSTWLPFRLLLLEKEVILRKKVAILNRTVGPNCSVHLEKQSHRTLFFPWFWGHFLLLVKVTESTIWWKCICSCLAFSTEHQGVSLLSTVRLTASLASENPLTHHSVMSTFLPGSGQGSAPGTFSIAAWAQQIFFFSALASLNTAICLMSPRDGRLSLLHAIYEAQALWFISFFTIYQY